MTTACTGQLYQTQRPSRTTRSPRRVCPNVKEVPSTQGGVRGFARGPHLLGPRAKPGTNLGCEVLRCSPEHVELVGDVHELASLDLRVARGHPALKLILRELRVFGERAANGVHDVMQEIAFIAWITLRSREDDPVRASSGEQDTTTCRHGLHEPAPRLAMPSPSAGGVC